MSKVESKKWITPELTVLIRGKNEETVLAGCKSRSGSGSESSNSVCTLADELTCTNPCIDINLS